jgi:hypothetical protein
MGAGGGASGRRASEGGLIVAPARLSPSFLTISWQRVEGVLFSLIVASLGFSTVSVGQIGAGNVRPWEILLLLLVLFYAAKAVFLWRFQLSNPLPLLLGTPFLCAGLVSGLNAVRTDLWLKQIILLGAMWLLCMVTAQSWDRDTLANSNNLIIYPGIVVSIWAILQVVLFPETLQAYSATTLESIVPRARGFFAEANEFSQYLCVPFGFGLAQLLVGRPRRITSRVLISVGLVILIAAQLMSFSRGGILAFGVQIIGAFLFRGWLARHRETLWRPGLTFLGVILLIGWASGSRTVENFAILWERIASLFAGGDVTASIRAQSISNAVAFALRSTPTALFGIGLGNLPVISDDQVATTANFAADLMAETGIFGLLTYVCFLAGAFVFPLPSAKRLLRGDDADLRSTICGAYLVLIGGLSGGLTYATHMLNFSWYTFGLLFAFHRAHRAWAAPSREHSS